MQDTEYRPDARRPAPPPARLAALSVGLLLLAVGTGVVWQVLAPLPAFEVLDRRLVVPDAEQETAVAADGWFAVCAAVAGVLTALAARVALPGPRLPVLGWVTVAGLAGSVLAWQVGMALGPDALVASTAGLAEGERVSGPLRLSALGVLLTWPLTSVVVLFALTAGLDRPPPKVSAPGGSAP